jgi:hypothetical protein
MENKQGDAKAGKSGSDLQNETPQKTEVKTSSFRGILFGINRLISKWHRSITLEIYLYTEDMVVPG